MENSLAISVAIGNQGSRVKKKIIYDEKFWAKIIFGYKELGPKIFQSKKIKGQKKFKQKDVSNSWDIADIQISPEQMIGSV